MMLNTRNVTDIAIVPNSAPLTREEIFREFSVGDISKFEQDKVYEKLQE